MSEAAARFRQPIDLDEFERRLRNGDTAGEPAGKEDPLAELARLVGQQDPFRAGPQLRPAAVARGSRERTQVPHLQQVHPPLDRHDPPFGAPEPVAATHATVPAEFAPPAFFADANQSVELADDDVHHFDQAIATAAIPPVGLSAAADLPSAAEEFPSAAELPPAAVIAASDVPRRSWRGVIILSTILATGFGGLAAALTLKHATSSSVASKGTLGGLPVILAGGPTKVQPPKAAAADTLDDQPSVLDKTSSTKPAKAKLVDNVERPVDLSQQPQTRPTPPVASDRATSAESTAANANSLAASPPPRQVASLDPSSSSPSSLAASPPSASASSRAGARTEDDADNRPPPPANGFPSPKRVKIVSVRPDGSIIGTENDPAPAPAASAPAPAASAPAPAAAASEPPSQVELGVAMPSVADPIAPRAPDPEAKATSRQPAEEPAAGTAKRDNDPVAALIDQRHGDRTASTRTDSTDRSAIAATDPAPAPKSKHGKKKLQTAELEKQDTGAAAGDGGTFAAQLAASPTESAARATMRKLQKKYGSNFSGHKLTYRRVRVDGKTVYRVRLTGLSKGDANSMCDKLQSDGGTCFVANN